MQIHKASDLQREGAKVFDDVECLGMVKIISRARDDMHIMTDAQLRRLIESPTFREVIAAELQA